MDSSTLKRIALAAALVAAAGLAAWLFTERAAARPCPKLLAVHLASMPGEDGPADDAPRQAPYGKRVILAAVVEARDSETGEIFYVAPVDDVMLGGAKLPPEKIRRSWPGSCGSLLYLWYTVEKDPRIGEYRNRLRPAGGYESTQVADVRPRDSVEHDPRRPNAGSAMFRVRAERHNPGDRRLLEAVSSPDAGFLNAGGDPRALHRVTIGQMED